MIFNEYFHQRTHNEVPFLHKRMRYDQIRLIDAKIAIEKYVYVYNAVVINPISFAVVFNSLLPSHPAFYVLAYLEQTTRV